VNTNVILKRTKRVHGKEKLNSKRFIATHVWMYRHK